VCPRCGPSTGSIPVPCTNLKDKMNRNKPDQINFNILKLNKKNKAYLDHRNKLLKQIKELKKIQNNDWSNERHLKILEIQKEIKI